MKSEKGFFFKSIFIKFVLAFILVGLLPLMTISYFVLETLPQDMEEDMISNYNQMLLYSSRNLELKIGEYNQISQLVYNYQSKEHGFIKTILENRQYLKLEEFLRNTVYSEKYIESVFLLDKDLTIFSYFSQNASSLIEGFNLGIYPNADKVKEDNRALTIIPSHSEDYFSRSENNVVSFVRNYMDVNKLPEEEEVLSIFSVEVNTDFIKNILAPLQRNDEEKLFVINKSGSLIYQTSNGDQSSKRTSEFKNIISLSSQTTAGYISDSEGFTFYRSIKYSDWIIIYKINHSLIFQLINEFKSMGLIIMIILIITLLFLAFTFSKKLSQPIKNITNQMKLVEAGDLTSEVHVKTHDEIHQLAQAFNRMISKLNEYINKAYVADIEQKKTELNAIRNQIRPHYLYNTLEIIRMSALEENANNTQSMIYALSEQMKFMIGYNKVKIPLENELELIQNYFHIVHIRYEKRFNLEIHISKDYYKYKILKFMIQPLIENSVMHGLLPKSGVGTVKITTYEDHNKLHIDIIDDGVGIPQTKLNEIKKMLENATENLKDIPDEHIGLINVQSRIQLIFGKSYGIDISSKINMGTLAHICIPIEEDEEL